MSPAAPTIRNDGAPGRRTSVATLAVILPFASMLPCAAQGALAEDLPRELVEAAKLIPATDEGLRVCLPLTGLENVRGVYSTVDAPPEGSDPGRIYTAASRGAYLGDGLPGVPAPPFAQALIDAGVVDQLRLTWRERRIGLFVGVPVLRDTGSTPGAPVPTAPPPDTIVERHGEAYVVSGPDAALFSHEDNDWISPRPPRIARRNEPDGTTAIQDADAPPGIWTIGRICYAVRPDRVLEYGDPVVRPNGIRRVTAAILFHPPIVPGWISDPRVIDAMPRRMVPDDVRFVVFRNDGDGWRPEAYPFSEVTVGRIHVVTTGSP